MRNDDMVSKDDMKVKRVAAVKLRGAQKGCYLAQRTPEEQAAIFRKALEAQRSAPPEDAPAGSNLPAIQGDKLYAGWDPSLRMHIRGRSHRRDVMKARGLVCAFD